ncbi:MAG: GDP-mannose 4,6-dehydratase, partial [Firmicutes bacterium]|nr:GDP-mannose 4,6-dehydratase [Candidatus Stercoripulliclostridium pullicola]
NNYGMNQYPEKLIPLAVKNILCGKPVPVYGDGGNVRDWIAVEDHSEAVYTVLERGRSGEVYNVGGGNERTNLEIVDGIIGILDRGSREFVRDRAGHDRRYALDTAKIYAEFGWKPKVPFEEGLIRTVQGYAKKG